MRKDKLARIRSIMMDRQGEPHLNPEAMMLLKAITNEESEVLETGSGSSTLWFSKRAKRVVSFEHKKKWYKVVLDELTRSGNKNFVLRLDPRYPEYGINGVSGRYDIILIDGRGRVQSILTLYRRLKKGGYLILDDSYRKKYNDGKDFLDGLGWEKTVTYNKENPPREATFWRRT